MKPGLIVPVVWPEHGPAVQVFIGNSTTGIRLANGCGKPRSFTCCCRYGMLYCSVVPQSSEFGDDRDVVRLGPISPVIANMALDELGVRPLKLR